MQAVHLLNGEMWHSIGIFLGLSDVFNVLLLNTSIHAYFRANYFWQEYLLGLSFSDVRNVTLRVENSRELLMLLKKAILSNRFYSLAVEICEASSVDRITERPNNILTESKCYLTLRKCLSSNVSASLFHNINDYGSFIQRKCCVMNDPCYWSSAPRKDAAYHEHITVQLVTPVSLVVGFTVTPYKAFFHPNAPTYAPKEVCIQFLHNTTVLQDTKVAHELCASTSSHSNTQFKAKSMAELQEGVYFESAYYPVKKSFEQQVFYFDRPQLCFAGTVRLIFKGFSQRQTLDVTLGQDYYICISHASIIGVPVLSHTNSPMEVQRSRRLDAIDIDAGFKADNDRRFSVFKDSPKNLVTLFDKYPDLGETSLIQRVCEVYDDSHIQELLGNRSKVVAIKENMYSFMKRTPCNTIPSDDRKTATPSQENCTIF